MNTPTTEIFYFKGKIEVIEKTTEIKSAVKEIMKHKILGFDTESKPVFVKGQKQKLALIQLATQNNAWLFRVFKTGIDDNLASILANKNFLKIGLATNDDIKKIKNDFGILTNYVIDIAKFSNEYGIEENGIKSLTERVLGLKISKKQRTSNWENNILNENQILYAANDAWLCREIYLKLINKNY